MGIRTGNPRGRPRGAKNKRTQELRDAVAELAGKIEGNIPDAFKGDAHAYLMRIYKDPAKDDAIRLDAAKAAAPYEKPKLASTELKGDPDKPLETNLIITFRRAE